ncbi:type II toxin-antitoxin system HicA family toxin [Jiella sonneratiae]|uniref:Type II toxin-antitoxin system HicA family toxin n=1 Tax=Jiella sonneratiae TaxID=2816856 RepID=A0ABS3J1A4_9HYPH|nr:type II toxin-antitoxin system HicA family toxin [Jiella sonneratiae]MBO0903452.1 type II toxin-antitoxin system HicA family toxin [Jiella sonneratiae]
MSGDPERLHDRETVLSELYRQISAILRENGCEFARQAGSHELWYSPHTRRHFSVPVETKSRHTVDAVLRQAGIRQKIDPVGLKPLSPA